MNNWRMGQSMNLQNKTEENSTLTVTDKIWKKNNCKFQCPSYKIIYKI